MIGGCYLNFGHLRSWPKHPYLPSDPRTSDQTESGESVGIALMRPRPHWVTYKVDMAPSKESGHNVKKGFDFQRQAEDLGCGELHNNSAGKDKYQIYAEPTERDL